MGVYGSAELPISKLEDLRFIRFSKESKSIGSELEAEGQRAPFQFQSCPWCWGSCTALPLGLLCGSSTGNATQCHKRTKWTIWSPGAGNNIRNKILSCDYCRTSRSTQWKEPLTIVSQHFNLQVNTTDRFWMWSSRTAIRKAIWNS